MQGYSDNGDFIAFFKTLARGVFYVFSFVSALICIFAAVPYLPPFKGYWIVAYVVFFGVCFAWFVIRLRAETLRRIRERELAEEAEEREKYFNAKREKERLENS